MLDTRYRAFISYSHRDAAAAEALHRWLERYRTPSKLVDRMTREGSVPRRLTPIFRDRDDLPTAGDLSEAVQRALSRSRFLIVICSPDAAKSEWVDKEIRRFKQEHGDGRILAVLPATLSPELTTDDCFPPALRYRLDDHGDVTESRAEPLAADLRESGDGEKRGRRKIVAGLIGVDLDDLVQRESHRRNLQLGALAGAFGVLALMMGGLALFAFDARRDAEMRRQQAEGLVEFMLTDLKEKLDAVGRLDALDSVGARMLDYYAEQPTGSLDADALGRRARAQLLVGEIDNLRGDLDSALNAYEQAAATTSEQLRRAPDNEQRIFDHAQSVFWVGYIAWQRGGLDAAETQFAEYKRLAERLVELNPEKSEWRTELGYAYNNLGSLYRELENWDSAIRHFERARDLKINVLRENPGSISARLDLGQSYSWLASVHRKRGDLDSAELNLTNELALYEEIDEISAGANAQAETARVTALSGLGTIARYRGDFASSLTYFRKAQDIAKRLSAIEPENNGLQEQYANSLINVADMLFLSGNSNEAYILYTSGNKISESLFRHNNEVSDWRKLYLLTQLGLIETSQRMSPEEKISQLETIIKQHSAVLDRNSADYVRAIAKSYFLLGKIQFKMEKLSNAKRDWLTSLKRVNDDNKSQSVDDKLLRIQLLDALQEEAEANTVRQELIAIGVNVSRLTKPGEI